MSYESDRRTLDALKSPSKKDGGSPKSYTTRSSRLSLMPSKNRRRMERRKILDITIDKNKKNGKRDHDMLCKKILIKTLLKRLQEEMEEELTQKLNSYAQYISGKKLASVKFEESSVSESNQNV